MDSQYALERFRQEYGLEYAAFLAVHWGPPPRLCPFCGTETIHKLVIGDPARASGDRIAAKWYMWCSSCLRGIYCPPGNYFVPANKPWIPKGDEDAIRKALPAGLKLIEPVKQKIAEPDTD